MARRTNPCCLRFLLCLLLIGLLLTAAACVPAPPGPEPPQPEDQTPAEQSSDLLSPTATPATLVFRGESYPVMCAPEFLTQDPALEETGWQIVPGPASDSEMVGPEEALKIPVLDMESHGGEEAAPESVNMTLVQFTGDGMTDVPAWLIKVSGFDYLFTGSDVNSEIFAKSDLYYLVDAYSGESLGMLARSAK